MKKLATAAALTTAILALASTAFAAFSLSVTPYEGGADLNFGKTDSIVSLSKEVVFRVTSTSGKQYRITESLAEPLTNAAGIVIPYQNVSVSSVPGSNRSGTISVDHEATVGPGMQVLYTSGMQGADDSFTLIYSLKSPLRVPGGQYRGRIVYSLEAVDGSEPAQRIFLTVLAEVESSKVIEIRTATDSKNIVLKDSGLPGEEGTEVSFDVKSDYGTQFRIFQFVETLRSQDGRELSSDAVRFFVKGAQRGSAPANPVALNAGENLIYASSPAGSGESFTVVYALTPGAAVKAGKYAGKIRYYITTPSSTENLETFSIEVPVEKIFDIDIKTETGGGTISFPDLKPGTARQFQMQFNVRNNTGKRYQVNQKVLSELINKEGKSFGGGNYTVKTLALKDTKGTVKLGVPAEMKVGEETLFISDAKGSPDSFGIVYEINTPTDLQAGDYSSAVSFSLSEL